MEEVKANKEPFHVCLASSLCLQTPVKLSEVNVISAQKNKHKDKTFTAFTWWLGCIKALYEGFKVNTFIFLLERREHILILVDWLMLHL